MNWEALGAVGEIIGAAGVIVSLGLYLVTYDGNLLFYAVFVVAQWLVTGLSPRTPLER